MEAAKEKTGRIKEKKETQRKQKQEKLPILLLPYGAILKITFSLLELHFGVNYFEGKHLSRVPLNIVFLQVYKAY